MATRRVLVDTGAWYALQVTDDEWHGKASVTLEGLLDGGHILVTTNHVVGETYTLLRVTCGHTVAMRFLDTIEESKRLDRIFVTEPAEAHAYRILRQYRDQDFSFVDATSFAVMRIGRIRHAFAFDQHFATARFLRVPCDLPAESL